MVICLMIARGCFVAAWKIVNERWVASSYGSRQPEKPPEVKKEVYDRALQQAAFIENHLSQYEEKEMDVIQSMLQKGKIK